MAPRQINIKHNDSIISMPAYMGAPFETILEWIGNLVEPIQMYVPEIAQSYCAVSGFPYAVLTRSEISEMVRHAAVSLKLPEEFDSKLEPSMDYQLIDAVERVLDNLMIRQLGMSRPAPSLTYSKDRLSTAVLSPMRQTAILLNTLIFDAGLFRDKFAGIEDHIDRVRKQIAMSAHIAAAWDDSQDMKDLHAALVELDAKYAIRKLRFVQGEWNTILMLRSTEVFPVKSVIQMVIQMIAYRDVNLELELTEDRWTRSVYKRNMLSAAAQEEHSNLVHKAEVTKLGAKAAAEKGVIKSPFGKKKPAVKTKAAVMGAALDSFFKDFE